MQKDKRNLTVAQDHLRAALEEVGQAQGQAEQSMARAAVDRAVAHLDLVSRRLEQERAQADNRIAGDVERAYAAARLAWQGGHDALNDWELAGRRALDPMRQQLVEAINAVDSACAGATTEEALRA